MSPFFPLIGRWLDMPSVALDGDDNMPLAQLANRGPVMRLVVAPGHEEAAILEMPGGQTGNPRSPYFGAGQADWLDGRPTPLLPGATIHTLSLSPAP
jgi:penicillin amidase